MRVCKALGLLAIALTAFATPQAEAFSAFKSRFSAQGDDCAYPDRNGNKAVLEDGETMRADPSNSELMTYNMSCRCPTSDYISKLEEPAVLACTGGLLVTARGPVCSCEKRTSAMSVTDVRIIHGPSGSCPAGYTETYRFHTCCRTVHPYNMNYSVCVKYN